MTVSIVNMGIVFTESKKAFGLLLVWMVLYWA